MKVLTFDTSTDLLYVSIFDDEKYLTLFTKTFLAHNSHSENLLNIIELSLKETNLKPQQIDKIIVGIGPGSYTGVRVALTIAKMFSFTLDIPLYTISSLDLIGSGYFHEEGVYAVTSIAKKNYLYGKIFTVKNGKIEVKSDDEFASCEEFINKKTQYQNIVTVDLNNYRFANKVIDFLAKEVKTEEMHNLVPNYLRTATS